MTPPSVSPPPDESTALGRLLTAERDTAYGPAFWLAYLSNTAMMVAVSILYRYADFVSYLGGGEFELGLIVGLGTLGSIAMRLFLARGIDHYGSERIWRISIAFFVLSVWGHLLVERIDTPLVYALRMIMTASIGGIFGSSIAFVSLRVPEGRIAEMVGMLGSSGFLGMALGPILADSLFGNPVSAVDVRRMFLVSASCGALSLVTTWLATWTTVHRRRHRQPPLWALVRRYHPGIMLLLAAAMGLGVGLPLVFLRAYTQELGLPGIQTFFVVYALTAFAFRVTTRRVTERWGIRWVVLFGMGMLTASTLLLIFATTTWGMMFPAVTGGIAHAFLFPAIVAGGSMSFPSRYRGLATTLVLTFFDIGGLIGQPLVGTLVSASRQAGLPAYPPMFLTIAAIVAVVAGYYAFATRTRIARNPAPTLGAVRPQVPAAVPLNLPLPLEAEPVAAE